MHFKHLHFLRGEIYLHSIMEKHLICIEKLRCSVKIVACQNRSEFALIEKKSICPVWLFISSGVYGVLFRTHKQWSYILNVGMKLGLYYLQFVTVRNPDHIFSLKQTTVICTPSTFVNYQGKDISWLLYCYMNFVDSYGRLSMSTT